MSDPNLMPEVNFSKNSLNFVGVYLHRKVAGPGYMLSINQMEITWMTLRKNLKW